MQHPRFSAAVLMQWTRLNDRWQSEKWEAIGVVEDEGTQTAPTQLMNDQFRARWLHPGYTLNLYRDEAEGYYLNLSAPQPFVFVMWRLEDDMARPSILTLSYNEAARPMDGGPPDAAAGRAGPGAGGRTGPRCGDVPGCNQ